MAAWARCSSSSLGLRPPVRPQALAAARPAAVRSWMRLRSDWPRAAKKWDSGSLVPVVVSMLSSRLRKPTPRLPRLLDRSDQMAKASTQPVESPHHEGIPFAKQGEC